MQEQTRPIQETLGPGPGGTDDLFAIGTGAAGPVTVCHGPYAEELPVGDMTVGEIRRRFADRLDIDPQSQAVLDGHEVGDDTIVRAGQLLTFVRKAGEKGGHARRL
jgi:hypothetical protein